MKRLLVYILAIAGLISCDLEKELAFDPVYDGGKIIIHGFISPNEGARVLIRKSVPVNRATEDDIIPGAQVLLYGDDEFKFSLNEVEPGYFISPPDSLLSEGVAYMLRVVTEELGVAESNIQYILPEVILDSIVYVKNIPPAQAGRLKYYLNDPERIVNNYTISYREFSHDILIGSYPYSQEFIMPYFNDNEFNGRLYIRDINYYTPFDYDTVRVIGRLYNISAEYMKFLESLDDYQYTWGDPFFDHTTPVYSNIKNGYGIFGSYTYSEKSVTYIKTIK